jgi:GTP-sensing pleiotropic transcriptional regulator CodY
MKGYIMKSYKSYIQLALKHGNTISVFDGEEWPVKKSTDYKAIVEAIDSVEESQLKIRNQAGELLGWALLIPTGSEEDIVDYSDNLYMNALHEQWINQ